MSRNSFYFGIFKKMMNWSLGRRATIHKHFSCDCNPSWSRYLSTMSQVEDSSYHLLSMRNQKMSHLQEKLPRLPVPRLEDTIRRYLKAYRVLLDDDAYRKTEQICRSFEHGEGQLLQNELLAYDKENQHTSYTTAFIEDSFLNRRDSLCITNYGINMGLTPGSQLVCATNLVVSIARFHRTLKAELLTPADSGGLAHRDGTGFVSSSRPKSYLMCMSQLNQLFGTSRIPLESRDELQTILGTRHLVVLHKGYIYTCNLLDDSGYILPASTIMANLHHILSESRPPVQFPVASLTAERRDVWARLRKKLQAQGHGSALSLIESALFCLCLDDQDQKENNNQVLFGSGGDRWFDKSVQVIVGKDGVTGIQFEHSWSNAMMAMYLINMITKDIQNRPAVTHENSVMYLEPSNGVQRLEFDLDSSLQTAVVTAKCNLQTISASTSFYRLEFQDYGSNFLKGCGVSPDSIVQLALQLAFTRMYGHHAVIVEICSTGTFLHGRTERFITTTTEALECCKAFGADSRSHGSHRTTLLHQLIEATSEQHKQLISEAATGQGFIQHLFVLHCLAMRRSQQHLTDIPEIFLDPAFQLQYHDDIFSTNIQNIQATLGNPWGPEGILFAYYMRETSVLCYLSTASTDRDLQAFSKTLELSLKEIGDALAGKHQKQMQ
uniref:carnitine O-palmitoyltransferase 2, mitochondrial-like isoform X1 n=2 Tax=Myxine glutinosa TaxID=7769 RepID=UPI00358F04B8